MDKTRYSNFFCSLRISSAQGCLIEIALILFKSRSSLFLIQIVFRQPVTV